jgi:hypothetical protein
MKTPYGNIYDEIKKWKDEVKEKPENTPIPERYYSKEQTIKHLEKIEKKLFSNKKDPLNSLVDLAKFLGKKNIIELGYAQIVDSIKYVICHCSLISDPDNLDQENINEALDEAFNAYILPQFDSYMPKLRKARILEEDEENKTITALTDVRDKLLNLKLTKSAAKISATLTKIEENEEYQSFL